MSEEQKSEEVVEPKAKDRISVRDVTTEGAVKAKELKLLRSFFLEVTTSDGETLSGVFTVKRLTLGEYARVGVIKAQYNAGISADALDAQTLAIHEWMAYCSVAVTQFPEWFKPAEMFDALPLRRVYEEARAFDISFHK